jgi:hypothetical protein
MSLPDEADERDVRDRLRGLRVDAPGDGFEAALHRRLVAAGPPDKPGVWHRFAAWFEGRGWVAWPALGLTAGVALFLALGQWRAPPAPLPAVFASASVPESKVAVIKLNFSADVAVESADFVVSLPEGLTFWADGEALPQRTFEWTQALSAGDNVIPIAVRGERPGQYRVTASATVGGERIEHEVLLEVTQG